MAQNVADATSAIVPPQPQMAPAADGTTVLQHTKPQATATYAQPPKKQHIQQVSQRNQQHVQQVTGQPAVAGQIQTHAPGQALDITQQANAASQAPQAPQAHTQPQAPVQQPGTTTVTANEAEQNHQQQLVAQSMVAVSNDPNTQPQHAITQDMTPRQNQVATAATVPAHIPGQTPAVVSSVGASGSDPLAGGALSVGTVQAPTAAQPRTQGSAAQTANTPTQVPNSVLQAQAQAHAQAQTLAQTQGVQYYLPAATTATAAATQPNQTQPNQVPINQMQGQTPQPPPNAHVPPQAPQKTPQQVALAPTAPQAGKQTPVQHQQPQQALARPQGTPAPAQALTHPANAVPTQAQLQGTMTLVPQTPTVGRQAGSILAHPGQPQPSPAVLGAPGQQAAGPVQNQGAAQVQSQNIGGIKGAGVIPPMGQHPEKTPQGVHAQTPQQMQQQMQTSQFRVPANKRSIPAHHHPYGQVAPRPMGQQPDYVFKPTYGPESFRYGAEVEKANLPSRQTTTLPKVRGGSRAQNGGIGKGLRHFSKTVLQKVKDKGTTTYIEVAEELMGDLARQYAEEKANGNSEIQTREIGIDHKNIRRRVYDALNVLMALDVIKKEKKEIKWVGLPTNSAQEYVHLKEERAQRIKRITEKRAHIHDLLLQTITIKNLTERNRESEKKHARPAPKHCLKLPFLLVNAPNECHIDAEMGEDGSAFCFNFSQPFKLSDGFEVMKGLNFGFDLEKNKCKPENIEKIKSLVPPSVASHIDDMVRYGFKKGPQIDTLVAPSTQTMTVTTTQPMAGTPQVKP